MLQSRQSRKSKSRPPAFCLSKQTSPQKSVIESTASHGLKQHVGVCGPSEGGQWNQPGQPARLIGIAERSPRRGGVGGRYSARLSGEAIAALIGQTRSFAVVLMWVQPGADSSRHRSSSFFFFVLALMASLLPFAEVFLCVSPAPSFASVTRGCAIGPWDFWWWFGGRSCFFIFIFIFPFQNTILSQKNQTYSFCLDCSSHPTPNLPSNSPCSRKILSRAPGGSDPIPSSDSMTVADAGLSHGVLLHIEDARSAPTSGAACTHPPQFKCKKPESWSRRMPLPSIGEGGAGSNCSLVCHQSPC